MSSSARALRARIAPSCPAVVLLLAAATAGAREPLWMEQQALVDVRLKEARDVTEAARSGSQVVALAGPVRLDGAAYDSLAIGVGFVDLVAADSAPLRLDVLGGDVSLAPEGRVLLLERDGGIAVRWTGLRASPLSGTPSVVEMIVSPGGSLVVQYLHLPTSALDRIGAGRVRALSLGGDAAPQPASARAYRLRTDMPAPPHANASGPPPLGCDDEVGTWCDRAGVDCSNIAGSGGLTSCATTVATTWSFDEGMFCRGCSYTYYVLVECGREMHIPMQDMEGLSLTITDVLTGSSPVLRCVNDAANGNAPQLIRCPGNDRGYGPPFDQASPDGTMAWGFPDCIVDADLTCADVPPNGGTVDRASPGEQQTMDCYIAADSGLCGLYRVDIYSGGYGWQLFANCNGDNIPQFPIYSSCTAAWAAFNPLPELAISGLRAFTNCPDLDLTFEVQNLGCVDHVGGVPVRIQDNCIPSDTIDLFVPDTIPANGSVTIDVPLTTTCDPLRIDVLIDPANAISECTESATVSACRAAQGVDSATIFACGCTAQLTANAGPPQSACAGSVVTLDGSASFIAPCASPLYRWLDEAGFDIQPPSNDPTVDVTLSACPTGTTFTLEVSCENERCVDRAFVRVDCLTPVAAAGADVSACNGDDVVLTGAASTLPGCAQPVYRWLDPAGTEIRGWDVDPEVRLAAITCAQAGAYTLEVGCSGAGTCTSSDTVEVICADVIASAGPDLIACAGQPFTIDGASSALSGCTEAEYRWLDADTLAPLTGFDRDPSFTGTIDTCPGSLRLLLEAQCSDGVAPRCSGFDEVEITCAAPVLPAPTVTLACNQAGSLACGVTDGRIASAWWDTDTSVDSDGDGNRSNDADATGCDAATSWSASGSRNVRSYLRDSDGCVTHADVFVDVLPNPRPPTPAALPRCAGVASGLDCGMPEAGVTLSWDVDIAADSSGNGVSDDDTDATTCATEFVYAEGGFTARLTATDARGCTTSTDVPFSVARDAEPGEAADLRVSRTGSSVKLTWTAAPASATTRIARGNIGTWYDHAADDPAGRGACDTLGATSFTDPDDARDGGNYYYLAIGVSPCAGYLGTSGFGFIHAPVERPDPLPTASCP